MKKVIVLGALMFLLGCGGGGGDDDTGYEPTDAADACSDYCSYACDRALDCMDMGDDQGNICATECLSTIIDEGNLNEARCNAVRDTVANMDCPQLLTMFGLARSRNIGENEKFIGTMLGVFAE